MKFYKSSLRYLEYIYCTDSHVLKTYKNVGIIIRLNGFIYFIPIDEIDKSDRDELNNMKKNTPTVLRMKDEKSNEYIGKLLFSNMFALPYKELEVFDYHSLGDKEIHLYEKDEILSKEI